MSLLLGLPRPLSQREIGWNISRHYRAKNHECGHEIWPRNRPTHATIEHDLRISHDTPLVSLEEAQETKKHHRPSRGLRNANDNSGCAGRICDAAPEIIPQVNRVYDLGRMPRAPRADVVVGDDLLSRILRRYAEGYVVRRGRLAGISQQDIACVAIGGIRHKACAVERQVIDHRNDLPEHIDPV